MKLFCLFGEIPQQMHRGFAIARRIYDRYVSTDEVALDRYCRLLRFEQAKADGNSAKAAAGYVKTRLSTLYRWRAAFKKHGILGLSNASRCRKTPAPRTARTDEMVDKVKAIRQQHPWGKAIIAECLRSEGYDISPSSVGRIIKTLLADKKIVSSSASKWHKSRHPRPWATRQRKKPSVEYAGQLIQIDHMKVNLVGYSVIVFTARDVFTNYGACMVAANATAASAARFYHHLRANLPFAIGAIQVDGGSEFKAQFEETCQMFGTPLRVIPPRSPKHNSNIENFNGTIRREVFNFIPNIDQSIQGIQEVLDDFITTYNTIRPNLALAYRDSNNRLRYATPFEYNQSLLPNPK